MALNQLFRNQLATCDRPGLRGRVLTLACEIQTGKRAWSWRVEFNVVDIDWLGKRRVVRLFEVVPEWSLQPLAEMEVAA